MTRVTVCVATLERPAMLARLLGAIGDLQVPPGVSLAVVVADNDPFESAAHVAEGANVAIGWRVPIAYVVEPRRGISYARNTAMERALVDGCDWIALLDDDEAPRRDWLAELLRVQHEHEAHVVHGPVARVFAPGTPAWVRDDPVFRSPVRATGTHTPFAETNNALIDAAIVRRGDRFEHAFRLSGGSDTHFFMRLRLNGVALVWAAEAVVEEQVPASRTRIGWMVRRYFWHANAFVMVERMLLPRRRWLPARIAKSLARLGLGVAGAPLALAGPRRALQSAANVARGVGGLAGALGVYVFREYAEVHGE